MDCNPSSFSTDPGTSEAEKLDFSFHVTNLANCCSCRHRALKATTVQFNFVSFDDLVSYLPKFRQTFPNVVNFEFLETDINCLGQLNALATVQGIASLFIGDDGNPIYHKNWRLYAIFRLEHWGLQYVNNAEVTTDDILEANATYGALGELAIMVLPQSQISAIIRRWG